MARLIRCLLVATLLSACRPAPALAQGGPPLITDDPDTPGPGYWEINIAMLLERTRSERRIEVPRIDLNYGIGRRMQAKFEMPWVALQNEAQRIETGIGHATAGLKWRFLGQEGQRIAWSIYPQLDFSIDHSSHITSVEPEGRQFLIPTELTLEIFHLEVNGEVGRSFAENGPGSWIFGLSAEAHVLPRLELLADLHGDHVIAAPTELIVVGGARVKLTSTMIALVAVGRSARSLPDEGPRTYAYVGVQLNLPRQFSFERDIALAAR